MITNHRGLLPVVVTFLIVSSLRVSYGAATNLNLPDPSALLQGVESRRLQIPPSALTLQASYRDSLVTNTMTMDVDFDGELRKFHYQAESEPVKYTAVFNGSNAVCYNPAINQVSIRSLHEPNNMKLFDPRALGLATYNMWMETLPQTLPYKSGFFTVELIGQESLDGIPLWHVRLTDTNHSSRIDYWVDGSSEFRVYKKEWNGTQTLSRYDNSNYPWLPSLVITKEYKGDTVTAEREIQIIKAKADVKFPKDEWTLAGMGIKRGTEILDASLKTNIGYWDGKELSASYSRAAVQHVNQSSKMGFYIICIIACILPLLLWKFSRQSRKLDNVP